MAKQYGTIAVVQAARLNIPNEDKWMKRVGHLWEPLISFPNLLQAASRARQRKRFRQDVLQFDFNLERELWRLHDDLKNGTYRPGDYHTFHIYEPKLRLISAAPYRDRVVHHALTTLLEEVFEPTFTADSYACRRGKGTHAAMRQAHQYTRLYRYVLKADIRKFFPSIDHQILKALIRRKIKDPRVLNLIDVLIDRSNAQEPVVDWFPGDELWTPHERRRGLPIGNQTSQFFANVYLNPLDHFVREQLLVRSSDIGSQTQIIGEYVRYADDFLIFSNDKQQLAEWRDRLRDFLATLRLKLHPHKSEYFPVSDGITFLGYRLFPNRRTVSKSNIRRFRRRIKRLQAEYAAGKLSLDGIHQRLMSWLGHARQGCSDVWLRSVFATIRFQKGAGR